MRRPTRRQAIFVSAGLAVVISLLFLVPLFQSDPKVQRYEAPSQSIAFDFAETGGQTRKVDVLLPLSTSQLAAEKHVQVFAILNVSIFNRYPETASGSVECSTNIFINDNQWTKDHHSTAFSSGRPDEWSGNHSDVHLQFTQLTYPSYVEESYADDKLDKARDNLVRVETTCTSHVASTGPTSAIVTLGPLYSLVTT